MRIHARANPHPHDAGNVGHLIPRLASPVVETARERRQATHVLLPARCWCNMSDKWLTREAIAAGVTTPCRRARCVAMHIETVRRLGRQA